LANDHCYHCVLSIYYYIDEASISHTYHVFEKMIELLHCHINTRITTTLSSHTKHT
jgi:hypothetical protein